MNTIHRQKTPNQDPPYPDTIYCSSINPLSFRTLTSAFFDQSQELKTLFGSNDLLYKKYYTERNRLPSPKPILEYSDYFIFNGVEIAHFNESGEIKSAITINPNGQRREVAKSDSGGDQNNEAQSITLYPTKGKGWDHFRIKINNILSQHNQYQIKDRGWNYLIDILEFNNPILSEYHALTLQGNNISLINTKTQQTYSIYNIYDPHNISQLGVAQINMDTISLPEHYQTFENGKAIHNCVVNAQNYQSAIINYTLHKKDAIKTIEDLEKLLSVDSLEQTKYSYISFDYNSIINHINHIAIPGQRNAFDIYTRTNRGHNFTYFIGIVDGVYGYRAVDSDRGFKENDGSPQVKSLLYHLSNFYFPGETSWVNNETQYVKRCFMRRIPDPNFIKQKGVNNPPNPRKPK